MYPFAACDAFTFALSCVTKYCWLSFVTWRVKAFVSGKDDEIFPRELIAIIHSWLAIHVKSACWMKPTESAPEIGDPVKRG